MAALTLQLERAISETGVPALAAARIADGRTETAVAGVRRLGEAAAVLQTDAFHLGSNTKAMTATLAGIAVDEGLLSWETERQGVTLDQLLRHTAGLAPYTEDEELERLPPLHGSPRAQRAAFSELVLAEPRVFAPGTSSAYSNAGYAVAATIVEDAYDGEYEDLVSARLFAPLAMEAGFGWPPSVAGHRETDGGFSPHDLADGYALPPILAPAGDVHASIDGYARFVEAHLNGLRGGNGVASTATFEHLHRADDGFALGWGVQELGGEETHVHSGSAETFLALVAVQPRRAAAAAVVANAAGPSVDRLLPTLLKELLR